MMRDIMYSLLSMSTLRPREYAAENQQDGFKFIEQVLTRTVHFRESGSETELYIAIDTNIKISNTAQKIVLQALLFLEHKIVLTY